MVGRLFLLASSLISLPDNPLFVCDCNYGTRLLSPIGNMWSVCILLITVQASQIITAITTTITSPNSVPSQDAGLRVLLSPGATITHDPSIAPRWSEFGAPTPGTVVNVATENDVLVTVCLIQNQLSHRSSLIAS